MINNRNCHNTKCSARSHLFPITASTTYGTSCDYLHSSNHISFLGDAYYQCLFFSRTLQLLFHLETIVLHNLLISIDLLFRYNLLDYIERSIPSPFEKIQILREINLMINIDHIYLGKFTLMRGYLGSVIEPLLSWNSSLRA